MNGSICMSSLGCSQLHQCILFPLFYTLTLFSFSLHVFNLHASLSVLIWSRLWSLSRILPTHTHTHTLHDASGTSTSTCVSWLALFLSTSPSSCRSFWSLTLRPLLLGCFILSVVWKGRDLCVCFLPTDCWCWRSLWTERRKGRAGRHRTCKAQKVSTDVEMMQMMSKCL